MGEEMGVKRNRDKAGEQEISANQEVVEEEEVKKRRKIAEQKIVEEEVTERKGVVEKEEPPEDEEPPKDQDVADDQETPEREMFDQHEIARYLEVAPNQKEAKVPLIDLTDKVLAQLDSMFTSVSPPRFGYEHGWCEKCSNMPSEALETLKSWLSGQINDLTINVCCFSNPPLTCSLCNILGCAPTYPVTRQESGSKLAWIDLTDNPNPDGTLPLHHGSAKHTWPIQGRNKPFTVRHRDASSDINSMSTPPPGTAEKGYGRFRALMQECVEFHGRFCTHSHSVPVYGMRLINCTNRTLEPAAPDKKYAALSYVWGSPKEAPTSQARSPFRVGDRIMVMERTIEDALLVALEMGLDYIWVDRYCINQSDPSKHRQIRQMDTIYNNAELTIVAAAGDDPTSGLPGVSSAWPRPNPKLESYRMGNIIIFEDPDYGIDVYANFGPELAKSPWGQRAWTFQEGMFSRRCLVFMEKLTAFTCNETPLESGIELGLRVFYTTDMCRDDDLRANVDFCRRFGQNPGRITDRIEVYSRRALSYQSDILSAFSGCFRAYEHMDLPIYHYWGVPILPSPQEQARLRKGQSVKQIKSTSDGFVLGMNWVWAFEGRFRAPRRRPGFPSWSWTGWDHGIKYTKRYGHSSSYPFPAFYRATGDRPELESSDFQAQVLRWLEPVHVAVEMVDGRKLRWSEFEAHRYLKDRKIDTLSTVLHVNAWTFQIKFRTSEPPCGLLRDVTFTDIKGRVRETCLWTSEALQEELDNDCTLGNRSFTTMFLRSLDWKDGRITAVVLDERDGVMERVAHFEFYWYPDSELLQNWGMVRRTIRLG